jgi:methyltransferase
MNFYFYSFISFIVFERIVELIRSKQNEKWLRENGAKEYGKEHYKYFIILHALFFTSLVTEYNIRFTDLNFSFINYLSLLTFTVLQFFRLSIFISLGKYWNTRILVIPDSDPIKKGLYKYFRHPNYMIVIIEIITVPLSFSLYYTLIIFSFFNLLLLNIRTKEENKALHNTCN